MIGNLPGARHRLTGEHEKVLTLRRRQPQRPRQRGQYVRGRIRRPALFEPHDVVDGQAGELGEFLTPQAWRAPASVVWQADLGRFRAIPPGVQRPAEIRGSGHLPSIADRPRPVVVLRVHRLRRVLVDARGSVDGGCTG
ncbi:hypothetical protein SCOCK_210008 [Actinacidiphila cocklensis]|uniref:Uncharacterized protein n=1 Tax=Actinacidiphila cocklensis TaxID=887465 RepID=A0A9W4DT99_9ACTN|nr:hypothetical protein SCOCK_210008 [Actinacidiphila cocklensis]